MKDETLSEAVTTLRHWPRKSATVDGVLSADARVGLANVRRFAGKILKEYDLEQMERDHRAMEVLRMHRSFALLRTDGFTSFGSPTRPGDEEACRDPATAILGDQVKVKRDPITGDPVNPQTREAP